MYLARDVMTTDVFKLRADVTVGDAMAELVDRGISGTPVVDGRGELVGIVSEYQLLEAIYVPQFKDSPIRDLLRYVISAGETLETFLNELTATV